ncbi:MAG TPA: PhoD-like phosphatase N-terminal domain-containing protein, partial [Nitrososphaeraceae archaeon]
MSKHKPRILVLIIIMMMMVIISLLVLNNIALLQNPTFAQNINNTNKLVIPDGVASGDVTDHSAILWSRANMQAMMHVQYDTSLSFSHAKSKMLLVDKTTDFAGRVKLDSLAPGTLYHYRI